MLSLSGKKNCKYYFLVFLKYSVYTNPKVLCSIIAQSCGYEKPYVHYLNPRLKTTNLEHPPVLLYKQLVILTLITNLNTLIQINTD